MESEFFWDEGVNSGTVASAKIDGKEKKGLARSVSRNPSEYVFGESNEFCSYDRDPAVQSHVSEENEQQNEPNNEESTQNWSIATVKSSQFFWEGARNSGDPVSAASGDGANGCGHGEEMVLVPNTIGSDSESEDVRSENCETDSTVVTEMVHELSELVPQLWSPSERRMEKYHNELLPKKTADESDSVEESEFIFDAAPWNTPSAKQSDHAKSVVKTEQSTALDSLENNVAEKGAVESDGEEAELKMSKGLRMWAIKEFNSCARPEWKMPEELEGEYGSAAAVAATGSACRWSCGDVHPDAVGEQGTPASCNRKQFLTENCSGNEGQGSRPAKENQKEAEENVTTVRDPATGNQYRFKPLGRISAALIEFVKHAVEQL